MKKTKLALILLLTLLVCSISVIYAAAAEQTVYVSAQGNDANDGANAAKAVKTLDRAFALIPNGGKIVLTGKTYTIDKDYSTPKSEGKYTLTSEMKGSDGKAGVVNYSGTLNLNSDFLIEDIRFKGSSTPIIACNGHNVTFGKNIKNDANSYIVGGANLLTNDDAEKGNFTEDYTITVESGTWVSIFGGNRRAVGSSPCCTISGDINIVIDGATFKNSETDLTKNQNSISGMNSMTGDLNLTVKSGEFYSGIFVIGRIGSNGKNLQYKGNASIKLLGGTFNMTGNGAKNGVIDVCQDSNGKFDGDYHLEISDKCTIGYKALGTTGVQGTATLDVPAALVAKASGFVRDVYVSDAGKDTNGGTSAADAYKTFKKASEAVADNGGNIIVCGNVTVSGDEVLAAAKKNISVTSVYKNENYKASATVTVNGTLAISSAVTFEDITLGGTGVLFANGSTLTLAQTVACDGNLSVSASSPKGESATGGQAILLGGSYNVASAGSVNGKGAASVSATLVSVEGASVKVLCVSGGNEVTGSAVASILRGEVTEGVYGMYGTGEAKLSGTAIVEISGGKINGKINALSDGMTGKAAGTYELSLLAGDLNGVTKVSGEGFTNSVGKCTDNMLSKLEGFSSTKKETVVFAKLEGAGNKDGSSPENAVGSIEDAIKLLGQGNGTIVICGPIGVNEFREPEHTGEIKITSRYAGVDYRRIAGAKLILGNKYILSGPVTFDDIVVSVDGKTRLFFGNGHALNFGEGVECIIEATDSSSNYPIIFGGMNDKSGTLKQTNLTVNGGTWQRIVGGNRYSSSYIMGDINVTVNGGNIIGYIAGAGCETLNGNVKLEINGGIIRRGVFGIYCESDNTAKTTGNIDVYLNGGVIKGKVCASRNDSYCSFNGTYTCYINKADLDSVTDIRGAANIRGTSESKRVFGQGVSYSAAPEGTIEVNNPLCSGADPWVIYHNGFYYMALVRGGSVYISKAATVADLGDAEPIPVWTPSEAEGLSGDIWSPELHYFPASEFGAEHEGWYLYVACIPYGTSSDDQGETRRCYALKAVTDDPQGSYMAPDTKKLNHATKLVLYEGDKVWCIGPSIFRIEGKTYLTWTGAEKEATKTRQNLNIALMTSPYQIKLDTAAPFCWPTESWEKHGATYNQTTNSPEVVEGATALYGPNGSVYCIYSVSGYWTDNYALASLKFKGGDPCDINNWEKSSAPIFVTNKIDVFGPGHAAFVQSADGQTNYFVYHGYKASGRVGGRYVHIEEYTFDEKGNLHLGSGVAITGKETVSVTKNPLPLSSKISLFGKSGQNVIPGTPDATDTIETPDTTTPDTTPTQNNGGNMTAIIIIIVAVVVVASGAAAFILIKKKKK